VKHSSPPLAFFVFLSSPIVFQGIDIYFNGEKCFSLAVIGDKEEVSVLSLISQKRLNSSKKKSK
jgi:hypothetical protein